ncbi:MAG: efflux RND transporter permease subunit, partial [Candidatus Wallbacteria bacterium]|nr:efflux RND transporter permease subunit [Candidatus Wallbacteria bacterium]
DQSIRQDTSARKRCSPGRYRTCARTGLLDKQGVEVVGGVVVVRYGANPLSVIANVKARIAEIAPSLPVKRLADGRLSRVTIVPFYDRSGLIRETLGTLGESLSLEILVTVIVVLVMMMNLGSSILISIVLPLGVLFSFIAMKIFGVDANIVALSGIAIAIGTMVDTGIILCENIVAHLKSAPDGEDPLHTIHRAASEVGSAIVTSISTTLVGFLPVFTMQQAEGKLFRPLAFTKTFALIGSLLVALLIIPPLSYVFFVQIKRLNPWNRIKKTLPAIAEKYASLAGYILLIFAAFCVLSAKWQPLGHGRSSMTNLIFTMALVGLILAFFRLFEHFYPQLLALCLRHKPAFLSLILAFSLFGFTIWAGFSGIFFWLPDRLMKLRPLVALSHAIPGLGKEFMPPLDEGSFLFMPTTMPHAPLSEVRHIISLQDRAITALPEIMSAVGKAGRAESPLDPAPMSMIETVINYHPEFLSDESGKVLTFRCNRSEQDLFRNISGDPVQAP